MSEQDQGVLGLMLAGIFGCALLLMVAAILKAIYVVATIAIGAQ